MDVRGDVVHLRGQVASEEQRRDVEEAARAAAEGHRICNEVSVFEVREPDREERIS
ncbi:BON domain-containing protein [Actinomadura sp. CNU-125]|uniref:BON domain-containing protein n=1 Tax=Actinomadura sp. CNU-125 TaxID=1904961 RepID=UPI0021CC7CD4|nr:BON domain-containing protein [Actinomadura sp. CNU-125]